MVTGADVQTDDTVEVINKNHVIATLTDDVPFVMEMVVENGRGYVPADRAQPERAGNRHHPDRRRLQPRDPRALRDRRNPRRPEDELRQADAGNLDQRLDRIRKWRWSNRPRFCASTSIRSCSTRELGRAVHARRSRRRRPACDAAIEQKLNMSLAELKLSVRATQLPGIGKHPHGARPGAANEDQLLEVRNFGETTLNEVQEKLADLGLRLGMRVPANTTVLS